MSAPETTTSASPSPTWLKEATSTPTGKQIAALHAIAAIIRLVILASCTLNLPEQVE